MKINKVITEKGYMIILHGNKSIITRIREVGPKHQERLGKYFCLYDNEGNKICEREFTNYK